MWWEEEVWTKETSGSTCTVQGRLRLLLAGDSLAQVPNWLWRYLERRREKKVQELTARKLQPARRERAATAMGSA